MRKYGPLCALALLVTAACESGGTSVPTPASVTATSALTQQAAPGTAVPEPPAVRVLDAQGRGLAGIGVTFAVTSGGGSVGTALATTNVDGVASAVSWTLGTAGGTHTLTATVTGLTPVTFTATALDPCQAAVVYTLFTTLQAQLSSSDCRLQDGEYADFYTFTTGQARGATFTMSSSVVDTYLLLADQAGNLVAINDDDDAGTGTDSALRVFFPAGSYLLGATSYDAGETGPYTLGSTELTANANCLETWLVPGVLLNQQLNTADCDWGGYRSDDYLVVLRAGQRIRIAMSSTAVDAYVEVYDENGLLADNDDGGNGTDALLEFVAPRTAVYLIAATTAFQGETGAYSLQVTTLAGGAAPALAPAAPLLGTAPRPAWTRGKGAPAPRVRGERRLP